MYIKYIIILLLLFPHIAFASVGRINGQFDVDQLGNANYSIPIEILPSPNGKNGALFLSYNSQNNQGNAGHGWNVSGFSSIRRCTSTLSVEGTNHAPDMSIEDRFSIDGQKLVAISGQYGAEGTEYRTEREIYMRIISFGKDGNGPKYFRVYKKNGDIEEYGLSANSRFRTSKGTLVWGVSNLRDRFGNTVNYTYKNQDGEFLPQKMSYGGNKNSQLENYRHVRIDYEPRVYPLIKFEAGIEIKLKSKVQSIVILNGSHEVWRYILKYENLNWSSVSVLDSVNKCVPSGECLKPTHFEYSKINNFELTLPKELINAFAFNQGWTPLNSIRMVVDINNDGFSDIIGLKEAIEDVSVTFGSPTGYTSVRKFSLGFTQSVHPGMSWEAMRDLVHLVDLNGDGYGDLIGFLTEGVKVAWGYDKGFHKAKIISSDFTNGWDFRRDNRFFADVNGDGLLDIVGFNLEGVWVATNNRNGFNESRLVLTSFSSKITDVRKHLRFALDINRDNLADIVGFYDDGVFVKYGSVNGFDDKEPLHVSSEFGRGWPNASFPRVLDDVNGDGLLDIVGYDREGVKVALGTGNSFKSSINWLSDFTYPDWRVKRDIRKIIDVNEDGHMDFVGVKYGNLRIVMGTGQPISIAKAKVVEKPLNFETSWRKDKHPFIFSDIDGDGTQDFSAFMDNKIESRSTTASGINLTEVKDGFGHVVKFNWRPLTDPRVYEQEETAIFPITSFQGAKYVVSQVGVSDGLGDFNKTSYKYNNGIYHYQGFGFLGFKKREITNHNLKTKITEIYSHDYTKRKEGLLKESQTRASKNNLEYVLLNVTTNSWNSERLFGNFPIYHVYNNHKTIKNYDLKESLTSQVEITKKIDKWGNIIKEEVETTDKYGVYKTTTGNIYDDDPDQWLLGRLKYSIRTNEAPYIDDDDVIVDVDARISGFQYTPNTVALEKEVIEPWDALAQTTEYIRNKNPFGLVDKVINSWSLKNDELNFQSTIDTINYDKKGLVLNKINSLGHKVEYKTYHPDFDLITTYLNQNDLITKKKFDEWGHLELETFPDKTKKETKFSWCSASCPAHAVYCIMEKADGKPVITKYYDAVDRLLRKATTGFDGRTILEDITYNTRGLIDTRSRPRYEGEEAYYSSYEYDILGRIVKIVYPDGSIQTHLYDGLNTITTDDRGFNTTTIRNAIDQKIKIIDAAGFETNYYYYASGEIASIVDTEGNIIELYYDKLGRKIKTVDPDTGINSIYYNGLGLPYKTKDNAGQITLLKYDKLGRKISQIDDVFGPKKEESSWAWDDGVHGKGRIHKIIGLDYQETYFYDEYSRNSKINYRIAEDTYLLSCVYDSFSRPQEIRYQSGLTLKRVYNNNGYLSKIVDKDSGLTYWEKQTVAPNGKTETGLYGNGIKTVSTIDKKTGRLDVVKASINDRIIHHMKFDYDNVGNLEQRQDLVQNWRESSTYDSLNRLFGIDDENSNHISISYSPSGNIKSRSDKGTYNYGTQCSQHSRAPGPHAVSSLTNEGVTTSFCYDFNGNMITAGQKSIAYSSYNKPTIIETPASKTGFRYRPDKKRYERWDETHEGVTLTHYIGPDYQVIKKGNNVRHRHIVANKVVLTIEDNRTEVQYLHQDHLGSTVTITNHEAKVIDYFRYDVLGNKIRTGTSPGADDPFQYTQNGFTGHEHIGSAQLIHMNGRVYDSSLGRFLSPDPIIQNPYNPQSLNRYSYVMNNPLSIIDPSGLFSLWDIFVPIEKSFNEFSRFYKRNRHIIIPVVAVVAAAYTGGMAGGAVLSAYGTTAAAVTAGSAASIVSGIAAGAAAGATAGAVSAALYGGNLEQVVHSASIGAVVGAIGGGIAGSLGKDLVGRAMGGGLNGFIQTGHLEGFGRGMVAGMIPVNLGIDSYYSDKLTNSGIGLARSVIRGYIIDEEDGAKKGVTNYLAVNGLAHAVGYLNTKEDPSWDQKRGIWKYNVGYRLNGMADAITFGNVVFYNQDAINSYNAEQIEWLWTHEAYHANYQSSLGLAYFPSHMTSQWIFGATFAQEEFMEYRVWMGGVGYETFPTEKFGGGGKPLYYK
ncbi:MAG: hypothetical protein GY797_23665 [Deltaproteobacteria bacterium]|nr:hypothetical protein [Deltaproteobacteria bacterium]